MNFNVIKRSLLAAFVLVFILGAVPVVWGQTEYTNEATAGYTPARSGGSYTESSYYVGYSDNNRISDSGLWTKEKQPPIVNTIYPLAGFESMSFVDNGTEAGTYLIPPDPMGAAGTDRVIAVVNVMIEARDKTGTLLWRDALKDFFSSLVGGNPGALGTLTFDPKIVYDHYEGRFVVVALERTSSPTTASRILLAVSKTSSPATATTADWYYYAIDSKLTISATDTWADYPGFEVDEEAIYITNNMFGFAGGYFGVRLWIVDKHGGGDWYATGATPPTAIYDPYAAAGVSAYATTTMPALVFGAGGAGPVVGTYLASYSGLTTGGVGGTEAILVIRVDNPLGAPTFTASFVGIGDIEDVGGSFGWPALPDAPQLGTSYLIEVNDRRTLDAVWRNNALWLTTTIVPNSGTDTGQTTAHWVKLNTSTMALTDQGDVGGEDIAPTTFTFFPSVAVNSLGEAKFGFSASASSIYAGAYVTGREPGDPLGTVQATATVHAGEDWYYRKFSGDRNRWGDYSGIGLDPSNERIFWIFNEYAWIRGTPTTGGQDGRWKTAWASCTFDQNIPVELTSFEVRMGESGVLLTWKTGSETENLGFHVYRSESENGEFVRVNTELIPGAGNSAIEHTYIYVDSEIEAGKTYFYKLVDVDFKGNVAFHGPISLYVDSTPQSLPVSYRLSQNFPNPFNPSTSINFALVEAGKVKLSIYSTTGQLVRTLISGDLAAGSHSIKWDGTDDASHKVASGVYMYKLETAGAIMQKKMLLAK